MRLIDADNILDFIDNAIKTAHGIGLRPAAALCLKKRIEDEPTIDPVRHGEWIPVVDGNQIIWECSECHVESEAWTDFCPICGSRNIEEMDEEAFEEALEEFRKNPKTYTLDEVEAELGLTAKKGKWVPNNVVNAVFPWCCSECNSNQADRTPYCQMCGARMEGRGDETDRC